MLNLMSMLVLYAKSLLKEANNHGKWQFCQLVTSSYELQVVSLGKDFMC